MILPCGRYALCLSFRLSSRCLNNCAMVIAEATDLEPDFNRYVLATASYCAYAVGELDDDHGRARAFECLRAAADKDPVHPLEVEGRMTDYVEHISIRNRQETCICSSVKIMRHPCFQSARWCRRFRRPPVDLAKRPPKQSKPTKNRLRQLLELSLLGLVRQRSGQIKSSLATFRFRRILARASIAFVYGIAERVPRWGSVASF